MKHKLTLGSILAVAIVAAIAVFTRVAVRSAPPYPADFVAAVQAGIASQAPCPTSSASVPQAVENAASFIAYRSGVTLSDSIKQKLVQLDQSALSGSPSVLTRQQVKDVIIANFMNTVGSVTDSQIEDIAKNSLRVLPCVVDKARPDEVQLRGSKGNIDAEIFRQNAIEFRNGSTSQAQSLRTMSVDLIGEEIDSRLNALAYASPEQWKVNYYSPYHVFMLAYALISDDPLSKSQNEMVSQMQSLENWASTNRGITCPSAGRQPYGDHGYIYCAPMSLFFSPGVQNDLLDRIQAIL